MKKNSQILSVVQSARLKPTSSVMLGICLLLATLSNTWSADYQFIRDRGGNWADNAAVRWNQNAPWDGTPPNSVGPQASDNLDIAGGASASNFLMTAVIDSTTNFAVDNLSATVLQNTLVLRPTAAVNSTVVLAVGGNLTLSANSPSFTIRNNTSDNILNVSVGGNVNVGASSTLSLGAISVAFGLAQFTVTGTTAVSGTLLNNRLSLATNLGDLQINSAGSVVAIAPDNAVTGATTLTLTSRSLSGSGSLSGASLTGNGVRTATLALTTIASTNANFSGALIDSSVVTTGTNTLGVTVSGSGIQTFSGNNTYTGQTLVNGGTLLVNGTHVQSAAGVGGGDAANGLYRIGDGATLGGSGGRIAGSGSATNTNMVLVQSGGTLAPGASIGMLTLDGANISGTGSSVLNMASGAEFSFELAGDGSDADRIRFWNYAGASDFVHNNNVINLSLSGSASAGNYEVILFDFFSNNGTNATASGILGGLTLTGANIDPFISAATLVYNSNEIRLQYTVIPEPSTWLLLVIGLCTLTLLRHRKRQA